MFIPTKLLIKNYENFRTPEKKIRIRTNFLDPLQEIFIFGRKLIKILIFYIKTCMLKII